MACSSGNVHAATDDNFNLAHRKSAGMSPPIDYQLEFFVPKTFIDAVRHAHDYTCKTGPIHEYHGGVPEEVILSCKDLHKSSNNIRKKKSLGD